MNDNYREMILNLNELTKDVYGKEKRISSILDKMSFENDEIILLKTKYIREFLQNIEFAMQCKFLGYSNGRRFYTISRTCRWFGSWAP